jgi:hypothetical protein
MLPKNKKPTLEADKRGRINVYPSPLHKQKGFSKLKRILKRLIQIRKGH